MSDCSLTASDLTEPLPSVEQLPCRAVEGTVEVLEGRDVPRDGRLIVTCSIPGTVVENDPCGSPYTLYTLQYDALYVYDGSSGSKKLKMGKDDPISLKKVVPPSECTRSTVTDSERMVKKSAVTTSVRKINVADGKKESGVCDATIARGSSTSSTGKGEDKSKEDEDGTSDVCKPRSKCVTGKTTAQKHRLVLHTKFVQRRFREFVCLHNALWVHPKLRFSLRGVTGPSKWRHLPHGKLDSATVSMRRLFLENYMQILLQRIDINTSSIMRQFLCYDSDSKTGEYRTPFEIDWSLIPDSYSPREVSTSVEGAASRDQLFSRHQEEIALPYRAASEQTDTRPKAAICPEQRPTSLFCQDSSSSIASLSSFREPPHVSSATDELNEISLVNVLDIDNCELNIALTAELQPCAMEEALFEDFMVGDAAYSPDLQESSSDHHGVSVAPATAHNITNQPDLPVSSFLVPTLDQGLRKIYPEKNSLLVVSEPHCSPENTALIHAFHLSDLGNCVADSLSHALRLPLSYPDVGLLRRSVNTIKDCTMSTFSSSHPLASTSSMRPVDPLAAGGQEAVTTSAHDKHELSPQTSLLLTSKKMSSVNTETISLCDFSVDDSVPIVTHRRASVEGIGEAERETAFSRSPEIWNSCPHSIAVSSGPQSRSAELGVTEHVKGQVSWENLSSSRKENIQGEVSVHRLCHPSCRTPEESSSLHAASCSPSSSTLVPETSLKRPASTLLNILNGIQSVEHPYGDCIGVKYYCPNCSSRVKSCTRCEGSAIPDVTLPLQLVEELGDYSTSSTLASQSDRLHEKESGNVVFDTVIALLNSRQGRNGKTSSYVLTEPIVQLMVRWLVPSITAVIDDKLDQLFSDENVANFIHEILTNSNLEADSKAAKRCRNESVKFSPVLEYERFLAALGDSSLEDSHLDVDALKELLVSSMPVSPCQRLSITLSTPHHLVKTSASHCQHLIITLSTPHHHTVNTSSSPCQHLITLLKPLHHPVNASVSPCQRLSITLSTPQYHPVNASVSPCQRLSITLSTPQYHPVNTSSLICVQHTVSNTQCPTHAVQHTVSNTRCPTHGVQHTVSCFSSAASCGHHRHMFQALDVLTLDYCSKPPPRPRVVLQVMLRRATGKFFCIRSRLSYVRVALEKFVRNGAGVCHCDLHRPSHEVCQENSGRWVLSCCKVRITGFLLEVTTTTAAAAAVVGCQAQKFGRSHCDVSKGPNQASISPRPSC
ncbi:Phoxous domain [Trinorchestia longiramus]|nr:Phoxous domain [Trinorchestia longiramus]